MIIQGIEFIESFHEFPNRRLKAYPIFGLRSKDDFEYEMELFINGSDEYSDEFRKEIKNNKKVYYLVLNEPGLRLVYLFKYEPEIIEAINRQIVNEIHGS